MILLLDYCIKSGAIWPRRIGYKSFTRLPYFMILLTHPRAELDHSMIIILLANLLEHTLVYNCLDLKDMYIFI